MRRPSSASSSSSSSGSAQPPPVDPVASVPISFPPDAASATDFSPTAPVSPPDPSRMGDLWEPPYEPTLEWKSFRSDIWPAIREGKSDLVIHRLVGYKTQNPQGVVTLQQLAELVNTLDQALDDKAFGLVPRLVRNCEGLFQHLLNQVGAIEAGVDPNVVISKFNQHEETDEQAISRQKTIAAALATYGRRRQNRAKGGRDFSKAPQKSFGGQKKSPDTPSSPPPTKPARGYAPSRSSSTSSSGNGGGTRR